MWGRGGVSLGVGLLFNYRINNGPLTCGRGKGKDSGKLNLGICVYEMCVCGEGGKESLEGEDTHVLAAEFGDGSHGSGHRL